VCSVGFAVERPQVLGGDPSPGDRPARGGQIPHPARAPIVQPGPHTAGRAPALIGGRLHSLLHFAVVLGHRRHPEPEQPEHHRRRDTVITHLGPPSIDGVNTSIVRSQVCVSAQPSHPHTAPSSLPSSAKARVGPRDVACVWLGSPLFGNHTVLLMPAASSSTGAALRARWR
jgi:hypothetical protein